MANNFVLNKLIDGLNPQQRLAVTHSYNANTLVIAGAGSGKTNVLTKRIAFIIEIGYSSDNILAVTFTNKASDEMRKRVAKYIGEENSKKLLMGTFHSICVKLLRQFGREIGVPKYFTIYDTKDSKQIVKEVMLEITGNSDKEVINTCISKISTLKNNMINPSEFSQSAITPDERLLAIIYEKYQNKLAQNKSLDFDDLIFKAVNLLSYSKKALSYCNNRFKFVMCDEYQDTNSAQNKLLNLIVGNNNLFVVGDDSQGIYGWRGANIDNILQFKNKYPGCNIIKLEQNYRSTQVIVNAGNELIKHNTKRLDKVCFSNNRIGEQIKIYNAINDKRECEFIANEIKNLVTYCNKKYKDIAILYRVNSLTRELEDRFMNEGIPYEVVKGLSFYDRKEIKDIISIMRSTLNPDDNMSLKRYFNITPKIGKKTIDEISDIASKDKINFNDAVKKFDGRSKNNVVQAMKILSDLSMLVFNPIPTFLEALFKTTGYMKRLASVNTEENQNRIANLEELINIATEFSENNPNCTLEDFLDRVSLSTSNDKTNDDNRVKMLTVHASKGLEYNTVFIMACEENIFPHKRSMNSDMDIEEERRLMYTAITRAEENLYITNSKSRMFYGNINRAISSRFISEIPTYLKTEIW